jgi:hypothetical protein
VAVIEFGEPSAAVAATPEIPEVGHVMHADQPMPLK